MSDSRKILIETNTQVKSDGGEEKRKMHNICVKGQENPPTDYGSVNPGGNETKEGVG